MSRKVRADVDLDAIRENFKLAREQTPESKAVAIVKANAYGHGALQVAGVLESEADAFGVSCIEEGLELREGGFHKLPVIMLEGFFDAGELALIDQHNFWPAVHSYYQLEALEQAAMQNHIKVLVKIDTGMHRLGFQPDEVAAVVARLEALECVDEVLLMTHFARADELDPHPTQAQFERFQSAADNLGLAACVSNSAAVMHWPEVNRNWVRPGIMIYGVSPFEETVPEAAPLKRAMTLSTEIIAIRDVEVGESVGYGGAFTCERPTRIGTISMGYGDGYPRQAKNGTPVVVCGKRAAVAGRVSMDMMTIDLTDIPEAKVGDRVELFGTSLPVEEVARWCDTIPYTLMTGLLPRVPRYYSRKK